MHNFMYKLNIAYTAIIFNPMSLWSKIEKNTDLSTGPLARPFARLLVRSHRSLIHLLQTSRFARALRCAHSFARSLTSLTPSLVGQWFIRLLLYQCFFLFSTIVHVSLSIPGFHFLKYTLFIQMHCLMIYIPSMSRKTITRWHHQENAWQLGNP